MTQQKATSLLCLLHFYIYLIININFIKIFINFFLIILNQLSVIVMGKLKIKKINYDFSLSYITLL